MHTHERTQRWLSLPRVAWGSALSLQLRPLLSCQWYTTCLELSHWLKTLSHQSICLSPTRPFICSLLSLRPTHQPLTLKWMRWRDGGLLYTRGWILFACIMLGPSDGSEEWRQAYYMYHSSFLDPILSLLSSSLLHAFCLSHTSGTILLFFFSLSSLYFPCCSPLHFPSACPPLWLPVLSRSFRYTPVRPSAVPLMSADDAGSLWGDWLDNLLNGVTAARTASSHLWLCEWACWQVHVYTRRTHPRARGGTQVIGVTLSIAAR